MGGPADPTTAAVAARLARLQEVVAGEGLDALLVSNLTNIRYLSGVETSAGMLLVPATGRVVLTTDDRYRVEATAALAAAGVEVDLACGPRPVQLDALLAAVAPGASLGVEAASVTWAEARLLEGQLAGRTLVPTGGLVERLRVRKAPEEVAKMQAAAALADAALADVLATVVAGTTELDVARRLTTRMVELGASGPAFDTIVGAGPNSAMPHASPSRRPIEAGELVLIDFGATLDGYRSDMSRTVWWGDLPDESRQIVDTVQRVHDEAAEMLRPGTAFRAVAERVEQLLAAAGHPDQMRHAAGHNIGLAVHERPYFSTVEPSSDVLEVGNVVTLEPGLYVEGTGGARVENMFVIEEHGARPLTRAVAAARPPFAQRSADQPV